MDPKWQGSSACYAYLNKVNHALCREAWLKHGKKPGYSVPDEVRSVINIMLHGDEEVIKTVVLHHRTTGYYPAHILPP